LRNRKAAPYRPEGGILFYEILSVSFQITILKVLAGQPEGNSTRIIRDAEKRDPASFAEMPP
jgi:hypothetical protein